MDKSDRLDAETLAHLAQTGWYREGYVKSEASDRLQHLLSASDCLIRIRMDIEAKARGILKKFGIRLGLVRAGRSLRNFLDQFSEIVAVNPTLKAVFASLIAVRETVYHKRRTSKPNLRRLQRKARRRAG